MPVLDPRVYRAAFAPAVLALIVAAFSVRDRPRPLTTTLAADAFDQVRVERTLRDLGARFPERRPGGPGDRGLGGMVAGALRADEFSVRVQRFHAQTIDGDRALQNVIGVRAGLSQRRIVVVAHRDASSSPATAELSGTAALLELGRVFAGRKLRRTLVLVSTSGGSGGAAGIREWASHASGVDAVLVLGDLGGARLRKPWVVRWSDRGPPAPEALQRTVETAVREEVGAPPGAAPLPGQLARLAFPLTLGEQGGAGAEGLPAVLLSASGERGPGAEQRVDPGRLRDFGRAALRTITALDEAPGRAGAPQAVLVARDRQLPGWALRLLVGALIVPVGLAVLDAFARARRRREPVGMWLGWVLASAVPFALAAAFVLLLAAVGLIAETPAPPDVQAVDGARAAALAAGALALLLAWVGARPPLLRALGVRGELSRPGAAAALSLVGCAAVVVVWLANPFAALLLLPALHLWMLAILSDPRPRGAGQAAALVAGLAPPLLVGLHYAQAFGLGPAQCAWNAVLLVAGGRLGIGGVLMWSLLLGCLASLLALLRARPARAQREHATVRGPSSYAGPGSLGGTESALRR